MTGLLLKEPLNLFYMPKSNFSNIGVIARDTVLLLYYLNKRELTLPNILNGFISLTTTILAVLYKTTISHLSHIYYLILEKCKSSKN